LERNEISLLLLVGGVALLPGGGEQFENCDACERVHCDERAGRS